MAGHSKWANIRFRKGAQDAKRAKVFTKLLREITTSARIAGIDPDNNPRLRTAIDKALSNNMPKDNIKRAIAKAGGNDDGSSMDEIRYEGYGPNGVAVLVECLTDNRNRTVAEVRHAFSKCGGNLGTDGSVAYLFEKTGVIVCPSGTDEDALMEAALEAGANDVLPQEDGRILVYTDPYAIPDIKQALIDQQFECEQADVDMIASTEVELDATGAEKLMRMTDMLEDLDDVQHVFSNAQISDEVIAELDK